MTVPFLHADRYIWLMLSQNTSLLCPYNLFWCICMQQDFLQDRYTLQRDFPLAVLSCCWPRLFFSTVSSPVWFNPLPQKWSDRRTNLWTRHINLFRFQDITRRYPCQATTSPQYGDFNLQYVDSLRYGQKDASHHKAQVFPKRTTSASQHCIHLFCIDGWNRGVGWRISWRLWLFITLVRRIVAE